MIYALCMDHVGLSVALFWNLFIFSVIYFQWLSCTALPHRPVRLGKSDELGNEKQVCVKCGDHFVISLSLPVPLCRPLRASRVELCYDKVGKGRRVSRENRGGGRSEQRERATDRSVSLAAGFGVTSSRIAHG